MKKFILFLFVLSLFCASVNAAFVTGGVEYNEEIAQKEVFSTPLIPISENIINSHLVDSQCKLHISLQKEKKKDFFNRQVALFSDNTYGIIYKDDPLYSWYYDFNGKLISFTKKSSEEFPAKFTKYGKNGYVINTGIKISKQESYVFSPNGKLIAHWKGNLCFDGNGNVIMIRKLIED